MLFIHFMSQVLPPRCTRTSGITEELPCQEIRKSAIMENCNPTSPPRPPFVRGYVWDVQVHAFITYSVVPILCYCQQYEGVGNTFRQDAALVTGRRWIDARNGDSQPGNSIVNVQKSLKIAFRFKGPTLHLISHLQGSTPGWLCCR